MVDAAVEGGSSSCLVCQESVRKERRRERREEERKGEEGKGEKVDNVAGTTSNSFL